MKHMCCSLRYIGCCLRQATDRQQGTPGKHARLCCTGLDLQVPDIPADTPAGRDSLSAVRATPTYMSCRCQRRCLHGLLSSCGGDSIQY